MIYLEKSSVNLINIQVVDMTTIDSPFYLFRFVDDQRKDAFLIELVKTNEGNPRFGIFQLDLPNALDMDSGKFEMFVYQSDQTGRVDYENMPELTSVRAEVAKEFKTPITYEREDSTDIVYSLDS